MILLVTGGFCVVAPTWILCAIGMGDFEDEAALQWIVRAVGLLVVCLSFYLSRRQ